MATMASAARDIPKASADRDNLAVVAADTRSVPVTSRSLSTHSHTLPTPPNSISPALPPHGLKAQLQKAKLEPIDSDLDLSHDGTGSPAAYDTGSSGGGGEPITPALLAREYLPDILLNNGPLAIRYIMGHLTSAVPGFATIPPAKARRLVVGALEGRTHGNGKDEDGDVVFEKVGWGRWDARKRGQPARQQLSPEAAAGIPISAQGGRVRPRLATSIGEDSATFSHDDRGMLDLEADRMSLDGSEIASCSEAPSDDDGDIVMGDDPDDVTDDEDWAAVGAAALRAASYNGQHPEQNQGSGHLKKSTFLSSRVHTSTAGGGSRSFSAGIARPPQMPKGDAGDAGAAAPGGFVDIGVAFGRASDAQEREAVEALLRLGSV